MEKERATHKTRVLIIEPDAELAGEMEREVRSLGYSVSLAGNHFKGLTEMEDRNFDFVLVSMENTGIDGLEFCKICKQRSKNGRISCPYLVLIGENRHLVPICESDAPANDFLIRPYLSCELKWRLGSGRSLLEIQGRLQEMLDIDPLTGLKNEQGIYSALREEVNRQGRKDSLLGVAVIVPAQFELLELTQGRFWAGWAKQAILRYLGEVLRNYDHLGILPGGNLCILSAENSYEGMRVLLSRLEDEVRQMQGKDPEFSGNPVDIKFRGVFLSLRIETKPGGMKKAVDLLWSWIEKQNKELPRGLTGYRGKYTEAGLEIGC
ncbi:MAG: hypothetical protein ACLFMP_04075 [Desulfonatronovibrionaceae bacterium]